MPRYDLLQKTALHVKEIDGHADAQYTRLPFPQRWYGELTRTVFRPSDEDSFRGLPLWATNNAIAALLPAVLTNNATGKPGTNWLAWSSTQPQPDPVLLLEMLRGGLMAAAVDRNKKPGRRPRIDLDALADVLGGFDAADLHPASQNLVFKPGDRPDRDLYGLLPQTVALHLVSKDWKLEHGSFHDEDGNVIPQGISTWRRTANSNCAEMVSWPPHCYETKNDNRTRYLWSYTLRISAQNQPMAQGVLLHVTVGIRRWARTSVWDGSRSIGVHLPNIGGEDGRIGVAHMKWQPGPRGKKEGRMVWDDEIAAVLHRISTPPPLPSPAEVAATPMAFTEPANGAPAVAAVVFRHGLGEHCKHVVGDGASAKDRMRFFEQITPAITDFATATKPACRINVKVRERPKTADQAQIDPAILAAAVAEPMEITAWYSTTVMRNHIIEAVAEALSTQVPQTLIDAGPAASEQIMLPVPGLDVTLKIRPVGAIAAGLQVDDSIDKRSDRLKQATGQRVEQTIAQMGAGHDGVARFGVVEMGDADTFAADLDPKPAVKTGAGLVGVLTNNVTPPKPETTSSPAEAPAACRQRARKAVADLLVRQTGILTPPPHLGTVDHPLRDVTALGLWVVRRNKEARAILPLAVAWMPDEPFARVRIPGTEDQDCQWLPHHVAARRLGSWDTTRTLKDNQVQDFFAEAVTECADGSDTVLFTLAQNIRSACPTLSNAGIVQDELAFAAGGAIAVDKRKGLRHVRLRTNLRDETSQHFGARLDNEGRVIDSGVGCGLWADAENPRLFYSTGNKPATAGPGSPKGSRIEPHWGRIGKDKQEGWKTHTLMDVWNPQLLELAVAVAAPDDEPAAWAALAHQHRYSAAHFSDALLLPGVLHLARKLGDGLVPAHRREPIEDADNCP